MVHNTIQDHEKIKKLEQIHMTRVSHTDSALSFHLMPPSGWLNDPNGLCQLHGTYHIFFQYSPYSAIGEGDKYWGHYETKDFINYTYTGIFLSPDCDLDKDGVYSGSAFVEDDTMYLYYTGNTMEDGDFDFTYEGRGSNTTLVTSKDGITASAKKCLLTSADYPHTLSCHVRDPKVFKENGKYYMVLGARTRNDVGCVLLYEAEDKEHFHFKQYITSEKSFGYMWECPDLFEIDGQQIMTCCPQGVDQKGYDYQNVYQCGYFPVEFDLKNKSYSFGKFQEFDKGFDIYATQTFADEAGRRILIGWMGIPDADYDNDATVAYDWIHALTMPRELEWKDGKILQHPLKEMKDLRKNAFTCELEAFTKWAPADCCFELRLDVEEAKNLELKLREDVTISWKDGLFTLSMGESGRGRKQRFAKVEELSDITIFSDTSAIEIFINNGETVLTTRVYSEHLEQKVELVSREVKGSVHGYELGSFEVEYKK